MEQSAGDALTDARRAGMHVIVKEALANGRLTTRNDALAAQKTLAALQVLAREFGNEGPGEFDSFVYKPDAAAIAIAMHQWFDAMVLSGASTTEQMRSNAGAITLLRRFRDGGARAEERIAEVLAVGRADPEAYWSQRSKLAWN
jgi:aryl-alcohol dehydrogenase-like predicted oxidoreductase